MKKLLLIDANSLIHRCFHALPPLTTPKGEPINAIYGLSSILLKVLRDHNPDYMVAAFDRPEPTFRDEMYCDYKAHRPPTDDKLIPQLKKAHEVFEKFGIKVIDKAGFEADDIIGTLAEMFKDGGETKVVIFSGDKDNLQLIEDKKVFVELLRTGVSKTIMYDENLFRQEYGFSPKQLIDFKAIIGDASDNIPGVRGIGPKGALELLRDYGSIEKIYEEVGLIPKKKIQEHLEQGRENAFLSKKLATIKKDIPLDVKLEELKQGPLDREGLKSFFEELGFKSLVERL
ncbi:MAG: 5'-3' exonuclease H3TH domain-containing protein [Candidatus Pacebacteria bacterium]|nr:5'-3' exonuclease H3TH domain-containing protein [Candidatus Paceibacterota bacterium]